MPVESKDYYHMRDREETWPMRIMTTGSYQMK
jgi:hypothetical protein